MSTQSMAGKTVVVTGASDGIGRVTAHNLATMGARVFLVGRNSEKTQRVCETIERSTSEGSARPFTADLSSQEEIHRVAGEILDASEAIDVLINNVGGIFTARTESVDGIEMTFALNHLSYFLLTHLLLGALTAAPSARIVNVSSTAHKNARLDFDDLQMTQRYSGWRAYQASKLSNLYFTFALARRLHDTSVTANALHPGFVASRFGSNSASVLFRSALGLAKMMAAVSPKEGAQTSVYLASAPEVEGMSGDYFEKCAVTAPSSEARRADAAERLWQISRTMTGTHG